MAAFDFALKSQSADIVLVQMRGTLNVVEAIEWCESDDASGVFSYDSVWDQNRIDEITTIAEITTWEFRFTDPRTAFDFKMRWC